MNLKKVNQKLAEIRDHARDNEVLSEEDRQALKELVTESLYESHGELADLSHQTKPVAHNDNIPLTIDQHFRLRLMEKTGTGSNSIH